MKPLIFSRLAALAAFCTLVTGGANPVSGQSLQTIKIAVLPSDSVSLAYYAIERGSFRRAGLDAEIISLQSGPAIAAAVASGAADFGAANMIALAVAHEKGIPFTAIAPAGVYSSRAVTVGLAVPKSSTIRTAKELDGRIVAVDSVKTLGTIATSAWMDRNGGDSKTLKYVEVPFGQMDAALAAGRVDAAFLPQPALGHVLSDAGRLLAAPLDAIGPELQIGAWFSSTGYAKLHPDIIRKFRAVMVETAAWAEANKGATAAIYEKFTKVPVSGTTPRMLQSGRVNLAEIQPLIDAAAKYGVLAKPFSAADLFAPAAR